MPPFRASLALLCLVSSASAPLAAQAPGARTQRLARVDSIIKDYLRNGLVPSVAVAIVQRGDTLMLKGFGLADRSANRAAGPATVYEIGSITKQFTASGILRLVEQGKVGLDDDVSRYVPSFPLQGHHVTVHQLLNHTSGIHNYTNEAFWAPHWAEDLSPDSILGFVAKDTFDFAPGTRHSYSNSGYLLLGMIIERVTGKPYAAFLGEQFFTPLKLRHTSYCPSHPADTSFALGYTEQNGQVVRAAYLSMTHPFAAGAICSTARDLAVWQAALHGGRVLAPASYARMIAPDVLPDGTRLHYGFGLGIEKMNGHPMIDHGGGINGFTTAAMYFPADVLNVVVLTNTDNSGNPTLLAGTIARAVLGLPLGGRLYDR
ncbi:MAG TPA: serine hydrolase domain-containing protein [Gemmatimonadales bacterium]